MAQDTSSVLSNDAFHALSIGAVLGSIAGILPPLAALAAAIWYAIQIWESKTVQGWRARWHRGKHPPTI